MLLAVETGATTSVLFVVVVILLGSPPRNQSIAVAFELMIGCMYTNTLL
jgi:hypothetical protein